MKKKTNKDLTGNNKSWDYGGNCVYGDNPFKEALYALENRSFYVEDECSTFRGRVIKEEDMYDVMMRYEDYLRNVIIKRIFDSR